MLKKIKKFFDWLFDHGVREGDIYCYKYENPYSSMEFYKVLSLKANGSGVYWIEYIKCHECGTHMTKIQSSRLGHFLDMYQLYRAKETDK